jgi:diphthine synthase
MTLYIVGAGLSADYLSLYAVRIIAEADVVYVDTYTSIAPGVDEKLVRRINPWARIVKATRRVLEEESYRVVEEARTANVVVLVPGDPLTATTHIALAVEARRRGVEVRIVPGVPGPYTAAHIVGLQSYRIGKMVTLVYPEGGVRPYSVVETIYSNMDRNLHTIVLLDLRLDEGRVMTIPEAAKLLLELEADYASSTGSRPRLAYHHAVGVARAGLPDFKCVLAPLSQLSSEAWPPPPHTLLVLAPRLHPMEEEALKVLCTVRG